MACRLLVIITESCVNTHMKHMLKSFSVTDTF